MSTNKNMNKAKVAKDDEFYTRMEDIEREVLQYTEYFKGKIVLCNCDNPFESNFFKFFASQFKNFGLKKLIATCYYDGSFKPQGINLFDKGAYAVVMNKYIGDLQDVECWLEEQKTLLKERKKSALRLLETGDFASPECVKFLDESDIVVTNPPFSCHSEDTEVLTNNGWKLIKDVDIKTDLIYSLNPDTCQMEYVKAVDFLCSPVKGELLHFKSHNMDFMVTGNHRMFTSKGLKEASSVKKTDKLPLTGFKWKGEQKEYFTLPAVQQNQQFSRKEITVPEKKIPMNAWLEFFGFWLADGCARQGVNSQGNQRYTVSIKQNKQNEDYVKRLYHNIGFECNVESRKDRNNNYTVYSKQLLVYLSQFGKSAEKYIPREFLDLSNEQLSFLLKGYANGDSHKSNKQIIFSSKSKRLMENIQEVLLKLYGQVTRVRQINAEYRKQPYVYYMIAFTKDLIHRDFAKYGIPEKVAYNSNVYCLTLERNHIMLVRHNDVIGWCGNCFRKYVALLMEHKKQFLIIGNKNSITYKEIFPLIKENKLWMGYTAPSDFMRPKDAKPKNMNGLTRWFTNLPTEKREEYLDLFEEYSPDKYPMYDNYLAINVDRVSDIPCNEWFIMTVNEDRYNKLKATYGDDCVLIDGDDVKKQYRIKVRNIVMGVPITFLDKYCPKQFEIVGGSMDCENTFCHIQKDYVKLGYKFFKQDGGVSGSGALRDKMSPKIPVKGKSDYSLAPDKTILSAVYNRIFIRKKPK